MFTEFFENGIIRESLVILAALIRSLLCVYLQMYFEIVIICKILFTLVAFKRFLPSMWNYMFFPERYHVKKPCHIGCIDKVYLQYVSLDVFLRLELCEKPLLHWLLWYIRSSPSVCLQMYFEIGIIREILFTLATLIIFLSSMYS